MKNISLEIVKVSYSGEFYFKAKSDIVISIYMSAVTTIHNLYQDFSDKMYPTKM